MNALETHPTIVVLSPADHQMAMTFAKQQPNAQHGQQIYLNILAVQAVHHYLAWFGIISDPLQSDSWQLIDQWIDKVADLAIPGIGKLECCPVLPSQTMVMLPSDTFDERLGYVAVEFGEQLESVNLRGFLPSSTNTQSMTIPLSEFQPLENLFACLAPLESTMRVPAMMAQGAAAISNLSHWLQDLVEPGWQTLEELLGQGSLEVAAARSIAMPILASTEDAELTVSRFRTIDFGVRINHQPLILMINVTPLEANERQILVRVMTGGNQTYLPEGLELKILNEAAMPIENLEVIAQEAYELIQLTFTGDVNETFNLQLNLDSETFQLPFVI
jgi:hypothetical protein